MIPRKLLYILNLQGTAGGWHEGSNRCAGLFDSPPWQAQISMQARREESETVMFTCIKDLLHSNKVDPSEVHRTCAFFSPSAWQKLVQMRSCD